jgi:hypothetical protein
VAQDRGQARIAGRNLSRPLTFLRKLRIRIAYLNDSQKGRSNCRKGVIDMPQTNKLGQRLVTSDFLAKMEQLGWPKVEVAQLGAPTIRAKILGPGKEAWSNFAEHSTLAQQHHIRVIAEYNPAIFTADSDA